MKFAAGFVMLLIFSCAPQAEPIPEASPPEQSGPVIIPQLEDMCRRQPERPICQGEKP